MTRLLIDNGIDCMSFHDINNYKFIIKSIHNIVPPCNVDANFIQIMIRKYCTDENIFLDFNTSIYGSS